MNNNKFNNTSVKPSIAVLWHPDGEERPVKYYTIQSPWYSECGSVIGEMFKRDDVTKLFEDALGKLNLISADDLDSDSPDNWYFDIFDEEKYTETYANFVAELAKQPILIKKAFLKYLSFQDYEDTDNCEIDFLINILNENNIALQESALNVLLEWDNFPDKEILKTISIKNNILMQELARFINEER